MSHAGDRVKAQAEIERLRELCATIIDVHAQVEMDTAEDRDLHDQAVQIFRDSLALRGDES